MRFHNSKKMLPFFLGLIMVLSMVVPSGRAGAAGNCAGSQVFCNGCLVQVIGGQNGIRSCDKNCTSVQIGNNVKCIGTNAFNNCTNLKNVTLPGCVNSVGSCAFNGCSNLSTVTLGANTKKIGDNAFKNCKNLKTINIKSKKLNSNCVSCNAFKGVGKNVTVNVPKDKVKSYKALFCKKGLCKQAKVCGKF